MRNAKLLKSATIIQSSSSFHLQSKDILIIDEIIEKIEDKIAVSDDVEVIENENLHVSAGWIDCKANLREPGEEWKETLASGAKAAEFGGFTKVIVSPSTKQPLDSANRINFIFNKSKGLPVAIFPMGTLSHEHKGEELSEMYEMSQAGAVAFTDDKRDVSTGLLAKSLLYAKNIQKLIVSFPNDSSLSKTGQIHEGTTSTKMGLRGIPILSEELRIQRDIALAEYHDTRIHFSTISSAKGVELIRNAKQKGLKVTCDIAAHQLSYTDISAQEYNANYKVLPPFREKSDIDSLIEGLNDGTIDAICSDHTPHDVEDKKLEFDLAEFGIIGLETAFASILSATRGKVNLETLIEKFTSGPSKIFKISSPEIKVGEKANLTLFNPEETWTFEKSDIKSSSKNTPFVGTTFTGKSLGIIC